MTNNNNNVKNKPDKSMNGEEKKAQRSSMHKLKCDDVFPHSVLCIMYNVFGMCEYVRINLSACHHLPIWIPYRNEIFIIVKMPLLAGCWMLDVYVVASPMCATFTNNIFSTFIFPSFSI